jgi:hypothetical protein
VDHVSGLPSGQSKGHGRTLRGRGAGPIVDERRRIERSKSAGEVKTGSGIVADGVLAIGIGNFVAAVDNVMIDAIGASQVVEGIIRESLRLAVHLLEHKRHKAGGGWA